MSAVKHAIAETAQRELHRQRLFLEASIPADASSLDSGGTPVRPQPAAGGVEDDGEVTTDRLVTGRSDLGVLLGRNDIFGGQP